MRIFHQAGHNTVWDIDVFEEDQSDGIIFSPVHFSLTQLSNLIKKNKRIVETSLFDPQFYVPNSQKSKLNTYDFFPEKALIGGFKTAKFHGNASSIAKSCIDFQIKKNFDSVIIPARFFESVDLDLIDELKRYLEPFLDYCANLSTKKEIYYTLVIPEWFLNSSNFLDDILDWITGIGLISGVYLIGDFSRSTKQISNQNQLIQYMRMVQALVENDLKVICGYCNTESLVLAGLGVEAVTIGAYENTRIFSTDKFIVSAEDRFGPAPRLYMPKLMNWIRINTLNEIRAQLPQLWEKIYTETDYGNTSLNEPKPHFTKNEPYKHSLKTISKQLKKIAQLDSKERVKEIKRQIDSAMDLYSELRSADIRFADKNCEGEHLSVWRAAIKSLI
jgi:hypothetical protein